MTYPKNYYSLPIFNATFFIDGTFALKVLDNDADSTQSNFIFPQFQHEVHSTKMEKSFTYCHIVLSNSVL